MKSKHYLALLCAAGVAGAWAVDEPAAKPEAEVTEEETPIVSTEFSVAYESHHVSYGLMDTRAPIVTPAGAITFFDLLTFDCAFVMDTTHYSRKLGIGNRRWQYWELDAGASLAYTFDKEEFDFLPTSVELGAGYVYEYHPRRAKCKTDGVNGNPDTQFVSAYFALPDLLIVPTFSYERDIVRDNGTYLNLELAHEFALIGGANEDDDPEVALTLAVAQGFGNAPRVRAYLGGTLEDDERALDHAGLMDTQFTATIDWHITDWLTLSPYVAYVDFLFDSKIRDYSRSYEPLASGGHKKDTSWHVLWGVTLAASF